MSNQFTYVCLLITLSLAPVKLDTPDNHLIGNNGYSLSETLKNYMMSGISSEKLINSHINIFDSSSTIKISAYTEVYNERDCKKPKVESSWESLLGTVDGNAITFKLQKDTPSRYVKISPDSNLQGFTVEFSNMDESQFYMSKDQVSCKRENKLFQSNFVKVDVCVRTLGLKRGSGKQISACFVVGGAILSSQFYDINTIDSYNGMRIIQTGLGCYSANDNNIVYKGNDGNATNDVKSTLDMVEKPLHDDLCGKAYSTAPSVFIIIFVSLTAIIYSS